MAQLHIHIVVKRNGQDPEPIASYLRTDRDKALLAFDVEVIKLVESGYVLLDQTAKITGTFISQQLMLPDLTSPAADALDNAQVCRWYCGATTCEVQ